MTSATDEPAAYLCLIELPAITARRANAPNRRIPVGNLCKTQLPSAAEAQQPLTFKSSYQAGYPWMAPKLNQLECALAWGRASRREMHRSAVENLIYIGMRFSLGNSSGNSSLSRRSFLSVILPLQNGMLWITNSCSIDNLSHLSFD